MAALAGDVAAERHQREPHLGGRRRRRQRRAERHGHRIRHARRPFPEESSAFEAEDAAPHAIEVDRHDWHVEPLHDALEAAPERQQVARAADRSFGEDADDVAVLQFLARPLDGSHGVAPRRDRDRLHQRHEPAQRPMLVIRAVDEEADETLHAGADEQAVDVRDVIHHQQRRAACRNVLRANLDAAGEQVGHRVEDRGGHPDPETALLLRHDRPFLSGTRHTRCWSA